MGEHLARMGHRDVCWIAPAQGEDDHWVEQRLAGLREGLGAAGRTCAVAAMVPGRFERMASIGTELEADPVYGPLASQIRQVPLRIPPACPAPDSLFVNRMAPNYLWFRFVRREMEALFARLLHTSKATVWVACNDDVAVMALDFLQRRRIACPGRVALAGFDDSQLTQTRDITSYNFNVPAAIQSVFDYIIGASGTSRPASGPVESPGFVNLRHSTSRQV